MRLRPISCFPLVILCLCACVTSSSPFEPELAPQLLAIAPGALGERTVEQRLVIRWPGGERSMDAVLEIAGGKLQLVMMSFGMRLMSVEYDGETVSATRHVPSAPPGERMINDLLMIAAPLEALRQALPANWSVTENRDNAFRRREVARDGATRVVIDYPANATDSPWRGRVEFSHRALGYQLILDSHEL
ncbi:MAG: DUF3261 domain-containing protein [Candidatus Accumulibacter sp.]|jgi:hypothetical protein|nr:DUF3261 domain-containing protein [Accumulibacter sp.]